MSQTANVRLAQPADAPLVASMLAEFRDAIGRRSPADDEIEPAVERVMGEGGEYLLAFDQDGKATGVAQFRHRWSTWHSGRDGWLEDLYVIENHRRLGVGRALVGEVIARAREHGCVRLELDVDEDNPAAVALYEALGFSDRSKGSARSLLMGRTL